MREGRNNVLKTDSQIKKTAMIKSIILAIIIAMAEVIFLWLLGTGVMWKYFFFPIALISIIVLYTIIVQLEEGKRSREFAEKYLTAEEPVEVIPIKGDRFILGLTDIAKFYAIIDEKGDKI